MTGPERKASQMTKHTAFERNMFARDLAACLALSDARKAENGIGRAHV